MIVRLAAPYRRVPVNSDVSPLIMRKTRNASARSTWDDAKRFVDQLPHRKTPADIVLLKGHLLIEEMLRGYIEQKLPNPTAFKHDQFSFSRVLMLCKALTPPISSPWVFEAAKKLNDARNEAAHELDSDRLQTTLDAFVAFVEQHIQDSTFPPPSARGPMRFYMAVADLYWQLMRILRAREG